MILWRRVRIRLLALALGSLLAAAGCDDTSNLSSDDLAGNGSSEDLGVTPPDLTVCQPTTCPAQTTVCKINICTANACDTENVASGTPCSDRGGVVCDGNGSCVSMHCMDQILDADESDVDCGGQSCGGCANGKMCGAGQDCASGHCPANSCAPKPPGMGCTSNSQCASGLCGTNGSGNCCSAACTGGSCGATGCDGSGACVYPGASVACGAQSCSAAVSTRHLCDGTGGCQTDTAPCANNLVCASATSCLSMCGGDPDCVSGYYCSSGCQPKQAGGATCTLGGECISGSCVDGFCCDSTCNGACQACAASKTGGANGTCLTVLDGQTDPRGVCGSSVNVCRGGACTGVPDAPGGVVATGGAASATLQWTVPAANGPAIDSYIVTGAGGAPIMLTPAVVCAAATPGSACTYTVLSLTNCTSYTFGIAAHNANGSSAVASATAVTPAQKPDTPSVPSLVTPASPAASMKVNWTAPPAHGCAIDAYDVYISARTNGGDHELPASPLSVTFTGLTTCDYPSGACDAFYTFSVRAHNAGGWSDYSLSASAVPKVSYAADNVAGIWPTDSCTSCHTSAQAPNLADASQAFANAAAEGALIYLCPEGASSTCPGHPVLLTTGNLDDTTLRRWVTDGNYP
jgi:hypothetical protein